MTDPRPSPIHRLAPPEMRGVDVRTAAGAETIETWPTRRQRPPTTAGTPRRRSTPSVADGRLRAGRARPRHVLLLPPAAGRADNELADALDQLAEAGRPDLADGSRPVRRPQRAARPRERSRWSRPTTRSTTGVRGGREARPRRAHGPPSARVRGAPQGGEPPHGRPGHEPTPEGMRTGSAAP